MKTNPGILAFNLWQPVPGFPGYSASKSGQIRSDDRMVTTGSGKRRLKGKILKPTLHAGYLEVTLCRNKEKYNLPVHTIILKTFVGRPTKVGLEARHLDGNMENCSLTNLKWGSHKANLRDRRRHGTNTLGVRNGNSKLDPHSVVSIRKMGSAAKASKLFCINEEHCRDIFKFKVWNPIKWLRDLELMYRDGRYRTSKYRQLLNEASTLLSEPSHPLHADLVIRLRALTSKLSLAA